MKIYSNPNFPRVRSELAALGEPAPWREQNDTMTFVTALKARNAKALEQLLEKGLRGRAEEKPPSGLRPALQAPAQQRPSRKQKKSGGPKQRLPGHTGPPIEAPGGHVHSLV